MSIEDEAAGLPEIPELPGWKSLPATGDDLHVSRQRIFQMGLKERKFQTLHQIPGGVGDDGEPRRPMGYVVRVEEVDAFHALQQAASGDAEVVAAAQAAFADLQQAAVAAAGRAAEAASAGALAS
jgi:hypothetical protein